MRSYICCFADVDLNGLLACQRVHRMLALMPNALRTKYVARDLVEEWTDPSGRLVLIGEAAHPLLVNELSLSNRQKV